MTRLTGLSIDRNERVVTIPIEYMGVSDHKRKTGLDQGWRVSGLPVASTYNDYGATKDVEAPVVQRPYSKFSDRGHLFMVRESLFDRLLKDGLRFLHWWGDSFGPIPESFKEGDPYRIAQGLLSKGKPVSILEAFAFDMLPYIENWVDFALLNKRVGESVDTGYVSDMVRLVLFITGALDNGFSILLPSFPDGSQISQTEDILVRELADKFNDELEMSLDWLEEDSLLDFETRLNEHIHRFEWVRDKAREARQRMAERNQG